MAVKWKAFMVIYLFNDEAEKENFALSIDVTGKTSHHQSHRIPNGFLWKQSTL